MAIRLTIDGKEVAGNLTGLTLHVEPSGTVAIDVQQHRPEYREEQERKDRDKLASLRDA